MAPICAQNVVLDSFGRTSPTFELHPFSATLVPPCGCHCHEPSKRQLSPMLSQTKPHSQEGSGTHPNLHGPLIVPLNCATHEPYHTVEAMHIVSRESLT